MVNHKEVEDYVLSMPNARLDYPFGKEVAVYKALISSKHPVALHDDGAQGEDDNRESRTTSTGSENRKNSTQRSASSFASDAQSVSVQGKAVQGEWKMFALVAEGSDPVRISLKCDPKLAKLLRERYESVMPGYHLNKKHWNTIILSGQLDWEEIKGLIRHSYNLVIGLHESAPEF